MVAAPAGGWRSARRGSRVPGPTMAAGADVPHDVATFVIEEALGLQHGFWGCVAEGATFRSLRRKRTEPGRAVIRRHLADLDQAEAQVNAMFFAWRQGVATPVSDPLDQALRAWREVPEGGELVRTWSPPAPRRHRRRR